MGFILLLLFYLLVFVDRVVGKRIEPGYDITDSDGSVKYRVGMGIYLVLLLIGFFTIQVNNMVSLKNSMDTLKWYLIFMLILFWGFQSYMEWKYVEGKKYRVSLLVMIIGVVATFGVFFVDEKITHTTFGEELEELLDNKEISKIEILRTNFGEDGESTHKQVTINDQHMINKFSIQPSEMELKKSKSAFPGIDYMMTIYTNDGVHYLNFSEMDIQIQAEKYFILDENELLKLIESQDLEWESESF